MNKCELKAVVVHNIGSKVDDLLEAARSDAASKLGANVALLACSKKVAELAEHVDKDYEEGLLDKLEPHQIAQAIKKYITRACAVIDSGAEAAARARLVAEGKIQMAQLLVGNLKKVHDEELAKSKAVKEVDLQASETLVYEVPSSTGRPPVSLKERRLAEEQVMPSKEIVAVTEKAPRKKSVGKVRSKKGS